MESLLPERLQFRPVTTKQDITNSLLRAGPPDRDTNRRKLLSTLQKRNYWRRKQKRRLHVTRRAIRFWSRMQTALLSRHWASLDKSLQQARSSSGLRTLGLVKLPWLCRKLSGRQSDRRRRGWSTAPALGVFQHRCGNFL